MRLVPPSQQDQGGAKKTTICHKQAGGTEGWGVAERWGGVGGAGLQRYVCQRAGAEGRHRVGKRMQSFASFIFHQYLCRACAYQRVRRGRRGGGCLMMQCSV